MRRRSTSYWTATFGPACKKLHSVHTSLWDIAHTSTEASSYLASHVNYFQAVVFFPLFSEDGYKYKPVVYLQSSWWLVGQICLLQLRMLSGCETSWLSPISKFSFNLTPYILVTSLRTEYLVPRNKNGREFSILFAFLFSVLDTKRWKGIYGNKMPTRCNRGFYCRS